jgi:2,3,4,5-tetrahydropyridine-2,6-dicarboxylate N-succinyltransferase
MKIISGLNPLGAIEKAAFEAVINTAWETKEDISPTTTGEVREVVDETLAALDNGSLRVAAPLTIADGLDARNDWQVNQWAKKAVLLSFRLSGMAEISGSNGGGNWWDKVSSKWQGWTDEDWKEAGFRAVPGSIARHGAYVGKNVVLMPSFVNIGAYVDEGTMVDAWATVGSCAQIGKNCHISGGVGIGGVLEPLQVNPTIIEDNCFIGARSEVVEGVIVREGSVLGMGVFIGQSTKIVDRETGEVMYGEVPAGSVVVAGSMPSLRGERNSAVGISLYCVVIVKKVDAQTRAKTSINELLRD